MSATNQDDITIYMLPSGKTTKKSAGRWAVKKWMGGVNQFFSIRDYDETSGSVPRDISGFTVTLKAKMGSTILISGACTLASATTGYMYYSIKSGDFPYTGRGNYGVELLGSGVKIISETYPLHIGRTI